MEVQEKQAGQVSQTTKLTVIALLLLTLGFISGWLGFLLFGDIAGSCRVLFVSSQAIIRAEEERIKAGASSGEKMFFGRTDEAFAAMEKIAKTLQNRRTKVLFTSSSTGNVLGGFSISNLVHKEVIRRLEKEAGNAGTIKIGGEGDRAGNKK